MKGGGVHEMLVNRLERAFRQRGLVTNRQVATHAGRSTGYGDLVVTGSGIRLLVEVEMTTRRVGNDLRKLNDLGPRAVLWIVAPNQRVQKSIQKRLKTLRQPENDRVFVLTFGGALKRVSSKRHFVSRP